MLTICIVLLALSLVVSAFFSGSETAILSANRFKLEYLERRGDKKASLLKHLRMKPDHFLATVLVGNTLVNAAVASLATYVFGATLGNTAEAIFLATATATLFLLIFSEITPKTFASHYPERVGYMLVHPIRGVMWLLTPFVLIVTRIARGILRLFGQDPAAISDKLSEEEFRSILKSGAEESGLAQTRRRMLASILEMSNKTLKDVMIPRTMVTMVDGSASDDTVLETIVQSGFSRVPVYVGHDDNVIGIAHAKDLLGLLERGERPDVKKILRRPFFIPASAQIETALNEFQRARVHMGVVVDEYGGVEGVVTLEDLLEEIVGEIQDESDEESELIRFQPDGSCLIDGGAAIYKVNERLGIGLPEEPGFSTIAGFVLSRLGRIPKEKEELEFAGRRLVVEKVLKRKIALLRLVVEGAESTTPTAPDDKDRREPVS